MFLRRLACLLLLLAVWPAQADDVDRELTEARKVFLHGVDGDRRAVRDATQRFKSLSHRHPQEPVFLAYLGAAMTLQGRDASNNIDKRRLTEDGLRIIDRALEKLSKSTDQESPRYLDTLLVAANSYIHIPSFFNRQDQGKRLLDEILVHHNFDRMAAGFKSATYLAAALVAQGEGDDDAYRRYLDLTVATDPEGRDGHFAGKLLEELSPR
jgi:hypothetical protein